MPCKLYTFIFLLFFAASSFANTIETNPDIHQHHQWHELLKKHVVSIDEGTATEVDYAGMQKDYDLLDEYLKQLSAVSADDFKQWRQEQRLAFLINAYNAFTVQLVLTKYPKLKSIKDIGSLFRSPWKKRFIRLLGNKVSLDVIEHKMIRQPGVYDEPRIHFAVNCASIGCPALRPEAFLAESLDDQLEVAVTLFLQSRSRNYIKGNKLYVSKIFDWYQEDFEKEWRELTSLNSFLARYHSALDLSVSQRKALIDGELKIKYTPYDWKLNKVSK